jgi:hypothetical protein
VGPLCGRLPISLMAAWCLPCASLEGFTMVLWPSGVPRDDLAHRVFPVAYCRTSKPRKSNPAALPSCACSVWLILVLAGRSSSPMPASHSSANRLVRSTAARSWCRTTKSSAYLTTCGSQDSLPFVFGKAASMWPSSPCSATLASSGEATPPWGVPSAVGNSCPPSMIPASSQPFTARRRVGKVDSFSSSAPWLMRSKHLAMSASRTYLGLRRMTMRIMEIASWQERPGLKA